MSLQTTAELSLSVQHSAVHAPL